MLFSLWNVMAMMAPWLLVGFFLAGVLSIFLPREWVVKAMGQSKGLRGVLNAVLIGVPLPICSCGVLPLTTGLRKAGAGKGAVAGFLISTPQTGIDSILATYSLMGAPFAIARPLAAFATGLIGGTVVNALTRNQAEEAPLRTAVKKECSCCHCHQHAAEPPKSNILIRILRAGYGELLGEIARPLAFGLLISAVVTAYVPANFFATTFGGNDALAMPAMALIGFPMYVCSTASIPIAVSLMSKGLSPGAAFVFLMVGPAINAASLATVSKLIGFRATVVYALIITLGAIACGIGVNILPREFFDCITATNDLETISPLEHISAIALIACLLYHFVIRLLSPIKSKH